MKTLNHAISPNYSAVRLGTATLGLLLLICAMPSYGQTVQFASAVEAQDEIAIKPLTSSSQQIHYGMPELRKPLPEIVYPVKAEQFQVEGRVIVAYEVNEKGRTVRPEVVKGVGYGCDEEVLRVLRQARFKPILDDAGQPQQTRYVAAFDFKLDDAQ